MSFDQLGLRVELLEAVKTKGYAAPTPIQSKAIPAILGGRDIFARAQTGTGKTDAFALPLVELLCQEESGIKKRPPRALVLTPTRELALQVGECIKSYARRVSLRCTVVYGGVRIEPQIDRVKRGIDILVATPGRLLDIAGKRALDLSRIEFLVFDEADRMLDLGFSKEISAVLRLVPPDRRTMLFSATYTQDIRDLVEKVLTGPEHIDVTSGNAAAEQIDQKIHMVDQNNKSALLAHLITRGRWTRVLVFTRTRHGANRLVEKLMGNGISAAALHSSKSQSLRIRTLEEFKSGEIRALVATDVAARGLDIINLPYVVNFDMPNVPEDYVHRIGRTGRAGVSGIALSLVSPNEKPYLKAIEELLNHKIPVQKVDGFTEGSDVPDFVLFRPGSTTSQKKAAREIKELVKERDAFKQPKETPPKRAKDSKTKPQPESRTQSRAAKPGAGDNTGGKRSRGSARNHEPESRSRSTKPVDGDKTGKKPSRSTSRSLKSSDNGRPKGGKQGTPGKQRKR